jgi:hypothetical protein
MTALEEEARETPTPLAEELVDLLSTVHDSVKVSRLNWSGGGEEPHDFLVEFGQRTAGMYLAKKVPRTVAEFLVSITTSDREYVIVQRGALPYPPP